MKSGQEEYRANGSELENNLLGIKLCQSKFGFVSVEKQFKDVDTPVVFHSHDKGQLVMPLKGMITCTAENGIWLIPEGGALWIPPHVKHWNDASPGARFCFTYIDSNLIDMPTQCCILSMNGLVREIVLHLSDMRIEEGYNEEESKLIDVLCSQLTAMKKHELNFPIPAETRLNSIASKLIDNPADRSTAEEWASQYAMSAKTLTRLLQKETGMGFRDWRKQLHIILALQKLSQGMSVQAVSDDLGYESVSAFITMFKNLLGDSPRKYMTL